MVEAGGKAWGTGVGLSGAGIESLIRSGAEIAKGFGKTGEVGEATRAISESLSPSEENQRKIDFEQRMANLNRRLDALLNMEIDYDADAGGERTAAAIAALREQIAGLVQQERARLEGFTDAAGRVYPIETLNDPTHPSRTELDTDLDEGEGGWWQKFINQPEIRSSINAITGKYEDVTSGETAETGEAEPPPIRDWEMLNDYDRYLEATEGPVPAQEEYEEGMRNILKGLREGRISQTPEQTGGIGDALTTDPNVWDQIQRITNVLGKGAGSSKGWEGINISKGMQAERAEEADRAFQTDQLDRQMDARLDLARMGEKSAMEIARAEALADNYAAIEQSVLMSTDHDIKERQLKEDYDKFFGGYSTTKEINGLTYDEAMKEWVDEEIKRRMNQLGMFFPGGSSGDVLGGAPAQNLDASTLSGWGSTVDIAP